MITNSNIEFTEEYLTAHADLVDWDFVNKHMDQREFSYEFFHVFSDQIDWKRIEENYDKHMTTEFSREFQEHLTLKAHYKNGVIHRDDDLPAVLHKNGTLFWLKDGKTHRKGGPAVLFKDGETQWYQKNKLHRWIKPAVECKDGTKAWFRHGKKHRWLSPALIKANGEEEWCLYGREYTKTEYWSLCFQKEGTYYTWRNSWLQFNTGFWRPNVKIGPAGYFDDRAKVDFSFGWGQFLINIPFIKSGIDECDPPVYGFCLNGSEGMWFPDSICLHWDTNTRYIDLPWAYNWFGTSLLCKDSSWVYQKDERIKRENLPICEDDLFSESYDFVYTLESGVEQHRVATVVVEKREWRPSWMKWTKLFSKTNKSIQVSFDGEVGEHSGTWRGGTKTTSYPIKGNETPKQCLDRMSRDKKM